MSIHDSSFLNQDNINGWLQELQRTISPEDKTARTVRCALELLQELDPIKYPQVADLAYELFDKAALKDNLLAVALKGIATMDGFGCKPDRSNALLLLKMAAERKCAEAKNYFGLLFMAKSNLVMAMRMFKDSAYSGHPRAIRNYSKIASMLREKITKVSGKIGQKQNTMLHTNRVNNNSEVRETRVMPQEQRKRKKNLFMLVR